MTSNLVSPPLFQAVAIKRPSAGLTFGPWQKEELTHQSFVDRFECFEVTGIANCLAETRLLLTTLEPDLILLDVYFADSNGIEVLKELRTAGTAVDVILITAAREVEMLHQALRGGALAYLIKPEC